MIHNKEKIANKMKKLLIIGVTACGKNKLAFELAQYLDAEIMSIDSMKVYRRMNIGTSKPSEKHRQIINYNMIDVVEPSESFSVATFIEGANQVIERLKIQNKNIVAVGGTALYIKALLYGLFSGPGNDPQVRANLQEKAQGLGLVELHRRLASVDPVAAERINPNDSKRIIRALEVYTITGRPISSFQQQWETHGADSGVQNIEDWTIIGLRREKTQESERINKRVKRMITDGLVAEVESLLKEDKPLSKQARCAIGYAEIIEHLAGHLSLDEATELIKKNTRKLAKAQRTWFKTFRNVNWLNITPDEPDESIFEQAKVIVIQKK
jgi:tRNA dimethylallyltransferase